MNSESRISGKHQSSPSITSMALKHGEAFPSQWASYPEQKQDLFDIIDDHYTPTTSGGSDWKPPSDWDYLHEEHTTHPYANAHTDAHQGAVRRPTLCFFPQCCKHSSHDGHEHEIVVRYTIDLAKPLPSLPPHAPTHHFSDQETLTDMSFDRGSRQLRRQVDGGLEIVRDKGEAQNSLLRSDTLQH